MATLTREQFYDLVWTRPITKLAKEFGLSDVALHKICRKHDIPVPPRGYWAKKAFGKPVTVIPLPSGSSGTVTKVRDVAKSIPQIVAAIAEMAVIKRENAMADALRKAAREEAERRRREAERRAALEKKREEGLAALLEVQARQAELTGLLADLDGWIGAEVVPPRLARLRRWLEARRDGLVAATSPDGLEAWLAKCNLFGDGED